MRTEIGALTQRGTGVIVMPDDRLVAALAGRLSAMLPEFVRLTPLLGRVPAAVFAFPVVELIVVLLLSYGETLCHKALLALEC